MVGGKNVEKIASPAPRVILYNSDGEEIESESEESLSLSVQSSNSSYRMAPCLFEFNDLHFQLFKSWRKQVHIRFPRIDFAGENYHNAASFFYSLGQICRSQEREIIEELLEVDHCSFERTTFGYDMDYYESYRIMMVRFFARAMNYYDIPSPFFCPILTGGINITPPPGDFLPFRRKFCRMHSMEFIMSHYKRYFFYVGKHLDVIATFMCHVNEVIDGMERQEKTLPIFAKKIIVSYVVGKNYKG